MRPGARRLAAAGVASLAVLAWLHLAWQTLRPAIDREGWRTPSYWVAPRLALEGRLELLYDDAAFASAAVELGGDRDIWMPNPPVTLLPLLPLAALDEVSARNLVLALGLLAVAATVVLLGRAARLTSLGWATATLGVALFEPLRHGIAWGQVYGLLLLAITVAALSPRPGAPAGAALGAASILKYAYPLAAAASLFVAGRVRAAATAGLVLAGGVVASVGLWGLGPWQAWLAALGPWADRPVHAVTALQMPRGLLTRLFELDPIHSPSPIVDAPAIGDALWLGMAAVVLTVSGLAFRRARRTGATAVGASIGVLGALLVSPYVDDYTYVLALLPICFAARELGLPTALGGSGGSPAKRWQGTVARLGLGMAALLLGADIPFREAEPVGLEALAWYPRVYGAALLWGLLVVVAFRLPGVEPGPATGRPAGRFDGRSGGPAGEPATPAGAPASRSVRG